MTESTEPRPGTLDFAARMNPDADALVLGSERRPWREWQRRASKLADFLSSELGLQAGDRVAWKMHNCLEYYDLSFALQKIGALGVPIGYRLTGSESAYIVDNSDAKGVVCQGRFAADLEGALAEMPKVSPERFLVIGGESERQGALGGAIDFEQAVAQGKSEEIVAAGPSAGSIIYTSGTTGRPKGAFRDGNAPGRQEALREFMLGVVSSFGFAPPEKHLLSCPLYHSAPPAIAGIPHLMGGTVVVMDRFHPEETLRLIEAEQIVSTFMVPTQLNRMAALPDEVKSRYDLSSMKRLIVGAAPFPYPLKQKVIDLFPNPCLYEFYGATETAINTVIGPEDQLRKPGSCGKVVPGNELKILDEEGNELPTGEVGLLYIRNAFLISGYYKNKEATDECLRDGFFTVGDMAKVDDEGFYYVVDRKKDMIISGGVNIYPAEIEVELRTHPAVYDCAVIGVPNDDWGEEVKAVVQLKQGADASEDEIGAYLAERLADYKRPRSIEFVDELPYNPSGKLLKKELRQKYWDAAGRSI